MLQTQQNPLVSECLMIYTSLSAFIRKFGHYSFSNRMSDNIFDSIAKLVILLSGNIDL